MGAASRTPGHDRAIHGLALLFTGLLILLSPMALNALGWNYDGLGGSGPTRFHPATYAMIALTLAIALRDGNPLASFAGALAGDAALLLFLMVWVIVLYHGAANQGLPAAGMVDTFLLPVLTLMACRRLAPRTRAAMAKLLHVAFAANALLGLGEFATGLRLTPYVAGGVAITDDWRSTALLGHPLGNALLTGCYAIILMTGGARELRGAGRAALLMLQFAGMIAFGGRASLVLLMAIAGAVLARSALLFCAGRQVPLARLALLALGLPLLAGGLAIAFELGVFDKFILRFVEDGGSAKARVIMFELFQAFTWPELLFGPPQAYLTYQTNVYGIEFGIESFWVAFVLYYGLLPAMLFFAALALFLLSLGAGCLKRAWLVLGYFFVVNSTFLGIAGKTVSFTTMCLMLLLLLPAAPARRTPFPARPGEAPDARNLASC